MITTKLWKKYRDKSWFCNHALKTLNCIYCGKVNWQQIPLCNCSWEKWVFIAVFWCLYMFVWMWVAMSCSGVWWCENVCCWYYSDRNTQPSHLIAHGSWLNGSWFNGSWLIVYGSMAQRSMGYGSKIILYRSSWMAQ